MKPFQLGIARELLENYGYDQPFSNYFASIARQHRNWGSKDRKIYRNACYAFFRLGYAAKAGSLESSIQFAAQNPAAIREQVNAREIFPMQEWVSEKLDFAEWAGSLLFQRPVYLTIKQGMSDRVRKALDHEGISFQVENDSCIKTEPGAKCDAVITKGWAWVMDYASQQAAAGIGLSKNDAVWDCCSGSGGKALYLANKYGSNIHLTCSDRRFTILENLKSRFSTLGFATPHIELSDLNEPFQLKQRFDTIILDVPCSGSGTWGRTPENITTLDAAKLKHYAKLQKTIVRNALLNLKPGGRVYYMTCSVFREENEENIRHFKENYNLEELSSSYVFKSYTESDVLFVAELVSKT